MISLLLTIPMSVMMVVAGTKGYVGHHIWDVPESNLVNFGFSSFWVGVFYVSGLTAIKISILLFYVRLSVRFSRPFIIATWVGIAYTLLYLVSIGIVYILTCWPVKAFWLQYDPAWRATPPLPLHKRVSGRLPFARRLGPRGRHLRHITTYNTYPIPRV